MSVRRPKVCMRAICEPSARAHFPDTHDYFNLKILCLKYNPSGVGLVSVKTGLEVRKMRIACLGGGPAGLYFAISMKLRDPSHEIVVIERNKPDDTFGWGVVLSDETLDNLAENDAVSAESIRAHFAYWDDIAVCSKGQDRVRPVTASAESAARSCFCCCRRGRASWASSCASRPNVRPVRRSMPRISIWWSPPTV
jgi:hypothetical protein